MSNLFPDSLLFSEENVSDETQESLNFKGSYLFDFQKGEFIKNPDGTIGKCNDLEAYMQWCQMALSTTRYKYIYSDLYGQEFNQLSRSQLSLKAIELEIKRLTKEALMVHPRTKDVLNFIFTWSDNKEEVSYNYEVVTIEDVSLNLNNTVKVG